MKKLQTLPYYPFLFALYPVAALYAHNLSKVSPADVLRPVWVVLAACAALVGLLWLLSRSLHGAALAASLWLMLFFSFGHAYTQLYYRLPAGSVLARSDVLLAVWAALAILGGWALLRLLRGPHLLAPILNVTAAAALVISFAPVVSVGAAGGQAGAYAFKDPADLHPKAAALPAGQKPDIYYIILDSYGSEDVLREFYGLDNAPFIDWLERRGFVVAEQSRSNYISTTFSLGSSLNYHYLQDLVEVPPQSTNYRPSFELIHHSAVRRFLEQQGYRTVAFATGFDFTELRDAEVFYPRQTPYNPFEYNLLMGSAAVFWLDWVDPIYHRQNVLGQFENLGAAASLPGPKFVFAHMIIPHVPFVFDENGSPVQPMGSADGYAYTGGLEHYLQGYRGQAQYASQLVEQAVDEILRSSPTPPVIILQGDHGPGAYLDAGSADNTCLRERFGILNALYLPGQDAATLAQAVPQDLTPVNTFRVVFNLYFGADLPMLPNRQYVAARQYVYDTIDVTGRADTCISAAYNQP